MLNLYPAFSGKTIVMKKIALLFTVACLVTGVAFAGGDKKKAKDKTTCNRHEGKTCGRKEMKEEKKDDKKADTTATAPAVPAN